MSVDRVALITGAARGIGAATVRTLHAQGVCVVALDCCLGADHGLAGVDYPLAEPTDLEQLAADLGERVLAVRGDVRDPQALQDAVRAGLERWGRLDVVVAAAGVIAGFGPAWQVVPKATQDSLWQINLGGVMHAAQAAIPVMLAGPDPAGCRFVAVASSAGRRGIFHLSAYAASKHAVVGFVRSLAADLSGTGVSAVAVAPGGTATAMGVASARLYQVEPQDLARGDLLQRLADPAEVAAAIAWAASALGAPASGSLVCLDGHPG